MKTGWTGGRYLLAQSPRPSRRRKYLFVFLFLLLILAAAYVVNLASMFGSLHNDAEWAQALRKQGSDQEIIFLLLGIDYWGAGPYVERLVLVHFDTVEERLSAVCIPGNTAVAGEDGAIQALGRTYRFQGDEQLIRRVQEFFGLPVHHYFSINYRGLIDLTDRLGGVAAGDLGKAPAGLLPAQKETLTGFEAYRYFLTAGHQETPAAQLERQRRVLLSLWGKLEGKKPWQWPRLAAFIGDYVETDLSWRELKQLRQQYALLSFDPGRIIQLPGESQAVDGLLYWVADRAAVGEVVRMLNEGYLVVPQEVRVEVLNGCGIPGAASQAAALLERKGFVVVRTGNAGSFDYGQTEVIALEEIADKARAVSLCLAGSSLLHRPEPGAGADVRVIIGHDQAGSF